MYVRRTRARVPVPPKSLCPVEAMLIVFTPARPRIAPFFVADEVLARDSAKNSCQSNPRTSRGHIPFRKQRHLPSPERAYRPNRRSACELATESESADESNN